MLDNLNPCGVSCAFYGSSSHLKCKGCGHVDDIIFDSVPSEGIINSSRGEFRIKTIEKIGRNRTVDGTEYFLDTIHCNSVNSRYIRQITNTKLTTTVYSYHECSGKGIVVEEKINKFSLDFEKFRKINCIEVAECLRKFYAVLKPHKFQHGNPSLEYIGVNSKGEFRMKLCEESEIMHSNGIIKKYGLPNFSPTKNDYRKKEMYCWLIRLWFSFLQKDDDWTEYFKGWWTEKEYPKILRDLKKMKGDEEKEIIYAVLEKYTLIEK